MEEQRKFKYLKNKLEAMNYYQPFSYDSMPLVEALLNDIVNLNSSLSRIRIQKSDPEAIRELSERIEYLKREKGRLEDEIKRGTYSSNFEDQNSFALTVEDLRRENKLLSQKLAGLQSSKSLVSEQRNNEHVDKLYSDFNLIKKQLDESEENLQKLNYENRCLQDRLRSSESQVSILRKDLDVSSMTIKEITNENRSTTEEFYSLKQVISSYESKINYYEDEINGMRMEGQKVNQYSRSLEQQISNLNKELSKNRNELEMAASYKVRLSSQLDSLQRQSDVLQSENTKLHNLRDEDKQIIVDLEEKCRDLEENFRNSQEKIRIVQRESQGFCEVIREKGDELRNKEQIKKGLEKELKEVKSVALRYEESLQENRKMKEFSDSLNQDILRLRSEIKDLGGNLKSKDDECRQLRIYLEQANKEIENSKIKIENEIQKNFNLNNSLKQAERTEETLRSTRNLLEDSEKREKRIHRELEQLQSVLQKTEEKFIITQKNFESAQSSSQLLQQENINLQKTLSDLSSQNNSKSIELSRYESRLQHSLAEIEDVKRRLSDLDASKSNLSDQLRDHHKALQAEQNHVSRQSEQISQLKDFISSLESSRSDCIKKLEFLHVNDSEKEGIIKRFKEEQVHLKKQLSQYERNISDSMQERERLLKEIESNKFESNRKAEEAVQLLNNFKRSNTEAEDLRNKIKLIQDSEENFKRSWRDSEIEKSRLHEINMALNLQVEDLKKNCSKYQTQFQDMSKDFMINDGRIKNLEERCKVLGYEKDCLASKSEELSRDLRSKVEILSGATREKEDLSSKIRVLSDEYDKLLRAYDYLNLDYKKLSGKNSASETLNENFKKQEEHYIRKVKDLEEELRNAIRAYEMTEYKRIEAEKTSEALLKDIHSTKTLSRELDNTKEDLFRKVTNLENEKMFLETRIRSGEGEMNNLRSQLEYEKKRNNDFESRSFTLKESMKRQELEDEKTRSLQTQNSDLVNELHRQIEMYKVEGLRVEMNYMKLLDELNLTKHKLNRAEARVADLELSLR